MLSLLMNGLLGGLFRNALAVPCAILAGIVGIFAVCGCVSCMRCSLRDCPCWKRLLRASGHDEFDDFELLLVVHQVQFERTKEKVQTFVRIRAGAHLVDTDSNSNGIFQQPLAVTVEQGVTEITVELIEQKTKTVLAKLQLDPVDDVLAPRGLARRAHVQQIPQASSTEMMYRMQTKGKGIRNPNIKLTMSIPAGGSGESAADAADSFGGDMTSVDALVKMQLQKARQSCIASQALTSFRRGEGAVDDVSELEVIREACSGPLELFQGLGKTREVHISILGPPSQRRWALAIWHDKAEVDAKCRPIAEIDLMRIQSVQADTDRHHILVINYYDESRVFQTAAFRRVDRARDVWVEILRLVVQKVRSKKKEQKGEMMRAHSTTSSQPLIGRDGTSGASYRDASSCYR